MSGRSECIETVYKHLPGNSERMPGRVTYSRGRAALPPSDRMSNVQERDMQEGARADRSPTRASTFVLTADRTMSLSHLNSATPRSRLSLPSGLLDGVRAGEPLLSNAVRANSWKTPMLRRPLEKTPFVLRRRTCIKVAGAVGKFAF